MLTALAIAGSVVAPVVALTGVIAFSRPRPLPPMASVANAFAGVDFADMPPKAHFTARDGTPLVYRAYPGDPARIAVLVHGSSGTSASMHPVARAIAATGATVYALGMRGHDGTGRSGDIDYTGQLENDLVDFLDTLGPRAPRQIRALLGFSSGGGFALRFAGGANNGRFDRLILVSPQFPYYAPTYRPKAGGWASVAIPRIVALSLLKRIGIATFGSLPVLAMAVDPARAEEVEQTPVYSFRMLDNFTTSNDYLGDIRRVLGTVHLFAGSEDEMFYADRYAPLLQPVRPDIAVTIVPGIDHMGMTVKPAALAAIAAAVA